MWRTLGFIVLLASMAARAIGQPAVVPGVACPAPAPLARVVGLDETGQFVGAGRNVIRCLIQDMRAAEQQNGSITVLFVHGWRNNADPNNQGFEEFLRQLDSKER